jgi:hypothetical protein
MRTRGWIVLGLLLVVPTRAHAYIDPGAGSMFLQILLGGIAGLAVLGRIFWKRLKTILPSRAKKSSEPRP